MIDYKEPTYNKNTYFYPTWAIVLGWCISATSLVAIPGMAVYNVFTAEGDSILKARLLSCMRMAGYSGFAVIIF